MTIIDLDPVDLMTRPHLLIQFGCDEVTLSRPIVFQSFGSKPPVLFVFNSIANNWQTVLNPLFTNFSEPHSSASLILACAFPGITFNERRADGKIVTLVDCRPPSVKIVEPATINDADSELPLLGEKMELPYRDLLEDDTAVDLYKFLGISDTTNHET